MSDNQPNQFPTTMWSGIERACEPNTLGKLALGELLVRYLPPLRSHLLLEKRLPADKVDDLLQAFISDRVLERDLLTHASRERGRFRTFLLAALDRFVSNAVRDAGRQCRSPRQQSVLEEAAQVPDPDPTPSAAFELAWAREVLIQAASRMREACVASNKTDLWEIFEARVLSPSIHGTEPPPYEQIAEKFALSSAREASNLIITAKRMFARNLKGVVGEYMGEDGAVDEEIYELRAVLAKAR